MLNRQSPLNDILIPGKYGAPEHMNLTLSERPIISLWQVAGWEDFTAELSLILTEMNVGSSGDMRRFSSKDGLSIWHIAPERVLIEGFVPSQKKTNTRLFTLDLTHARTCIVMQGSAARTVLSQLCGIDMDSFNSGEFVQTHLGQIGVLLQCVQQDSYEIFVPITWAQSLWELICINATPIGYEILDNESL